HPGQARPGLPRPGGRLGGRARRPHAPLSPRLEERVPTGPPRGSRRRAATCAPFRSATRFDVGAVRGRTGKYVTSYVFFLMTHRIAAPMVATAAARGMGPR